MDAVIIRPSTWAGRRAGLLSAAVATVGLVVTLGIMTLVLEAQRDGYRVAYRAGVADWVQQVEAYLGQLRRITKHSAALMEEPGEHAKAVRTLLTPLFEAKPELGTLGWRPLRTSTHRQALTAAWQLSTSAIGGTREIEPARRTAALAVKARRLEVSAPFASSTGHGKAITISHPAQREGDVVGAVTLTTWPGRLFAAMAHPGVAGVAVADITTPNTPVPINAPAPEGRPAPAEQRQLQIGNRVWQASFRPLTTPQLTSGITGGLGIAGIVLSALAGGATYGGLSRRARWQRQLNDAHADQRATERRLQRHAQEHDRLVAALAESESRYRLVAETSTDIISCHARAGHITYLSPAVTRLLGYPPEELVGMPSAALIVTEDRAAVRDQLRRQAKSSSPARTVFRAYHRDGHHVWLETLHHRLPASETWRWLCVSRDVSERRAEDQDLRANEEVLQLFFDNSRLGMAFISTAEARFLRVNQALATMLGYTAAELEELTVSEITHPADQNVTPSALQQALAGTQETFQVHKRYLHRDGSVVPIIAHTALVRSRPDNCPRFFVTQIVGTA